MMNSFEYIFNGKIYPERVEFSAPNFGFKWQHDLFEGEGEISISNSIINVNFRSSINHAESENCNIETLKNFIEDAVRSVVDSYCYINSYSYEVEITSVQSEELELDYVFEVKGEWNIEKTNEMANDEFNKIMSLYSKPENGFMRYVLSDFRRAIKYPSMTASFCFRAIETIRRYKFEGQSITNDNKRKMEGWVRLRNQLNLQRNDFDEIEHYALPNRHGEYPFIDYETRERIMNFTRKIINQLINEL